jgi:hypothetical protein
MAHGWPIWKRSCPMAWPSRRTRKALHHRPDSPEASAVCVRRDSRRAATESDHADRRGHDRGTGRLPVPRGRQHLGRVGQFGSPRGEGGRPRRRDGVQSAGQGHWTHPAARALRESVLRGRQAQPPVHDEQPFALRVVCRGPRRRLSQEGHRHHHRSPRASMTPSTLVAFLGGQETRPEINLRDPIAAKWSTLCLAGGYAA